MRFCLPNSESGVTITAEDLEKAPLSKLALAAQQPGAGETVWLDVWQDGSLDLLRVRTLMRAPVDLTVTSLCSALVSTSSVFTQVVAGCYSGKHLRFPMARTSAVLTALDFFDIPQAIRPKGLVVRAALKRKHDSMMQTASQLIDSIRPVLAEHMVPDNSGTAKAEMYIVKPEEGNMYLKVMESASPCASEFDDAPVLENFYMADPWLTTLLKSTAEGHGFQAKTKNEIGIGTRLEISLVIPDTKLLVV